MKSRILLFLIASVCLPGVLGAQTTKTLAIPGGARLQVNVPMGYDYKAAYEEQEGGMKVYMENPVWGILIVALATRATEARAGTTAWQEDWLISFMSREIGDSKEGDYRFKVLPLEEGTGRCCSFTLTQQQGGRSQTMCVTGGVKVQRGTAVAFKILSPNLTSPEYREALEVFTKSFAQP